MISGEARRRALFGLLLVGIVFLLSACKGEDANLAFNKGTRGPDFTLPSLTGEPVRFGENRGKGKTYLLFWSSSCVSCKEGMAMLEGVYRKRRESGFSILAVNVYQESETVKNFIVELGLTYPVLLDKTGEVAAAYDVYAVPVAYVIGADGTLLDKFMGEMTKENVEAIIGKYWSQNRERDPVTEGLATPALDLGRTHNFSHSPAKSLAIEVAMKGLQNWGTAQTETC